MRHTATVIILMLTGSPVVARAGDCSNPQTQLAMNECAGAEFQASDRQLNATYGQLLGRWSQGNAARQRLIAAEKAWLGFRDAECTFAATTTEGGSVHGMVVTTRRTALTKDRIKQLTAYLHCAEGDLSCPVPPG